MTRGIMVGFLLYNAYGVKASLINSDIVNLVLLFSVFTKIILYNV